MINVWQTHLFFSLSLFLLATMFVQPLKWRLVMLAGAAALGFLTIDGLSLAAYVRSFTDDLAITTLVALVWISAMRLGVKPLGTQQPYAVMVTVFALLALVLYPATLGLTYIDPYRLGFNPRPLIIAVAVITFGLLCLRNGLAVLMLGAATLAFALRIKPSENYWDYLLDPFLAVYCWVALLVIIVRSLYRFWRGSQLQAA